MNNLYKIFLIITFFSGTSAFAAWSLPSTYPSTGSASLPFNTGNTAQSKLGGIILSSGDLIIQNGDVGIGTGSSAPIAEFQVNGGSIQIKTNGAQADRVLTSDSVGLASWSNPPAILPMPMATVNAPSGAVMAFDISNPTSGLVHGACPSGWSRFVTGDGRVILGVGSGFNLGQTGGEAEVVLALNQIPVHYHTYEVSTNDGSVNDYDDSDEDDGKDEQRVTEDLDNGSTKSTGGQGHNNMMPYVGLTYCVKN